MMEHHGTKSLSILYDLKFFIVGVTLISVLASRNAKIFEEKGKEKKGKKRKGKVLFYKLQSLSGGQTATLQAQISLKTEHKSERCCISDLRDKKLL